MMDMIMWPQGTEVLKAMVIKSVDGIKIATVEEGHAPPMKCHTWVHFSV